MRFARLALFFSMLFFSVAIPGPHSEAFSADTKIANMYRIGTEKLTHLHFYLHSLTGGPNPNDVIVARAPTANVTSVFSFGTVFVIDDVLTEGPERSSKQIGNSQGVVAVASQTDSFLLEMAVSYIFTEGRYNGSSVSVLGRNPTGASIRELPIQGGTGAFRFERGYALTSTYSINFKDGVGVFEYDMYVLHR